MLVTKYRWSNLNSDKLNKPQLASTESFFFLPNLPDLTSKRKQIFFAQRSKRKWRITHVTISQLRWLLHHSVRYIVPPNTKSHPHANTVCVVSVEISYLQHSMFVVQSLWTPIVFWPFATLSLQTIFVCTANERSVHRPHDHVSIREPLAWPHCELETLHVPIALDVQQY